MFPAPQGRGIKGEGKGRHRIEKASIFGQRFALLAIFNVVLRLPASGSAAEASTANAAPVFRAGAYAVDVTPTNFPVIVNGGFLSKTATNAHDRLHARCLVLDDGRERAGICVLDTCLIPRELADAIKDDVRQATGMAPERILISATHTHSAPSLMQCLGTPADPNYPAFLRPRMVEGFRRAIANLAPARVGWAVTEAPDHTHTRTWIRRSDRLLTDPFGERTVRNNMHPGYQNPDVIGPSGPSDPQIIVLSLQAPDGRPLAVLANYSMHYFGAPAVSADYYGRFAEKLALRLGATNSMPAFVGIMSQGASGDQHWMDYSQPKRNVRMDDYADDLARLTAEAVRSIKHAEWTPLAMREREIRLAVRLPDAKRLEWARELVAKMGERDPKNQPEVYAREQLWLAANPVRSMKLQALRIGGLGIASWPAEVFAISGLKLKAQSPLQPTMNIELANGEEGYIPPPELHPLGGYNTWACRTAGLEVQAEPKMIEALLALLEEVAGEKRRPVTDPLGEHAKTVLATAPAAYWRMNEFSGPLALDAVTSGFLGRYEEGVVFGLEGPASARFRGPGVPNRAAHFAGGRLRADLPRIGQDYAVEFWFWNGLPHDARPVTGYLFSRGLDGDKLERGDHLGIGGTHRAAESGRLVIYNGKERNQTLAGQTALTLRAWHHVIFVREGRKVAVHLDGKPEISGELEYTAPAEGASWFFGGRCDGFAGLEGKLDEVAVYGRALKGEGLEAVLRHAALSRSSGAADAASDFP